MAITNFVPSIWSARLLTELESRLVARGISNQDYQGDASGGSVRITNVLDPTIGSYTAHNDITVDTVTDAQQVMNLDQQDYFAFEIDDIEQAQSVSGGAVMAEATQRAAYGLASKIDTYLLGLMEAGGTAGDAFDLTTSGQAYDIFVNHSIALDEADIPEAGRFTVVSPALHGKLLTDDRFISAGDAAGAGVRANGRVGEVAGLTVYKSNNLTAGKVVTGYRGATTLATQINKVEGFRMENRFADAVKGLSTYGGKVIRPTGLVVSDVTV